MSNIITRYLEMIYEAPNFRKRPDRVLRKPFKGERIVSAPTLRNVPVYIIAGCSGNDEFNIVFMIPSQINWPDYEVKPEDNERYIEPYGYFALTYYEEDERIKTWNEFSAGPLLKRGAKPKNIVKFKKIYLKEKFKCDVDTTALEESGTWRPFLIKLKNIKSKLFENNIEIRLSHDIHDYNVFVINRKFFNEEFFQKMPSCVTGNVIKPSKKPTLSLDNNTGIVYGIGWFNKRTKESYNITDKMDVQINVYLKYNNVIFTIMANNWRKTVDRIYAWHTSGHSIPSTDLSAKEVDVVGLRPEIINMIEKKKKFVDYKTEGVDDSPSYHTLYAYFKFDPKTIVYKRDGNRIEIHDIQGIKHMIKTNFEFTRIKSQWTKEEIAKNLYTGYSYFIK